MTSATPDSAANPSALGLELEAALLRELQHEWFALNDAHFHRALRAPVLELTDTPARLGAWEAARRRLVLSRPFVLEQPWGAVVEVLKHEMAHQFVTEVLRVTDESAHGRAFQQTCERFGVDAAAAGVPESRSDEEERILGRVARLLALAESPNENEAQAAMNAAQKLMLRYNLGQVERRPGYQHRHLGEPSGRIQAAERQLAAILTSHFFVDGIWVSVYRPRVGKRGSVLEICGTVANLEMASYVHAFLRATAERLWQEHKRKIGLRSDRDRQKFLAGVMLGFDDKLTIQTRENQQEGLVWVKDANLEDFFHRRHPRTRTVRYGAADSEALAHGRAAGREIVLHRPVNAGPGGQVRLLGSGK
jgi:hypothetical protein